MLCVRRQINSNVRTEINEMSQSYSLGREGGKFIYLGTFGYLLR